MKQIVVAFLLCTSFWLYSLSNEEIFLQGNKYFFDGQFDKARDCYQKLSPKNSVIWHNIGNCYYNENNCSKALVCWKRAQSGATFSHLGQLLDLERMVLKNYHFPCDGIFMTNLKWIILALPKLLLQSILSCLLMLFLLLFYQCCVRNKEQLYKLSCKKRYFYGLVCSIIMLMLLLGAKEKFIKEKQGVITTQQVSVYVGPETSFHQKMMLTQGCVVQVCDEKAGMVKVICPQGSGWIQSDVIEII